MKKIRLHRRSKQARYYYPNIDREKEQVISVGTARRRHIKYLMQGPHVPLENGLVLQSLHVRQEDLAILWKNARGGIRLYFCREDSNAFNVICAPLDKNGNNVLLDDPASVIVNTLEPCPTQCPPDLSTYNLNCVKKDGKFFWLKVERSGEFKWIDSDAKPVNAPQDPDYDHKGDK